MIHVDSVEDPRIDHYRDLPRANLTRHSGRFIVEGHLLVERLIDSDYEVESVLVDARRRDLVPEGLAEEVPIYLTAPGLVDQIIGFNFHRGILACGRRKRIASLAETTTTKDGPLTLVVCVDIKDQTNLGGILRNCAAFGVDLVLLSRSCADPFSRRVLRVSMGAVLRLPLVEADELTEDLKRLRVDWDVELAAAVLGDDAESLDDAVRSPRLGLLFGNEGQGLPDELVHLCSRRITATMSNNTDSLNAAVASGVFLYHFTRVAMAD